MQNIQEYRLMLGFMRLDRRITGQIGKRRERR